MKKWEEKERKTFSEAGSQTRAWLPERRSIFTGGKLQTRPGTPAKRCLCFFLFFLLVAWKPPLNQLLCKKEPTPQRKNTTTV